MIEEVKMPVDQKDLLDVTPLGHALMNKSEDVALYLVEKVRPIDPISAISRSMVIRY